MEKLVDENLLEKEVKSLVKYLNTRHLKRIEITLILDTTRDYMDFLTNTNIEDKVKGSLGILGKEEIKKLLEKFEKITKKNRSKK